jgi:hypothetical protein
LPPLRFDIILVITSRFITPHPQRPSDLIDEIPKIPIRTPISISVDPIFER